MWTWQTWKKHQRIIVWRQQAWMRVMWTLQDWKETRDWRFVHHRFGRTTTKRWDGTLCSHWPGWNTSSGGNARLDDTGISTKPQVFERKSFLSKSWSNTEIKEIKPKDLNCSSFEQLLAKKKSIVHQCVWITVKEFEFIRNHLSVATTLTIPFEHSFVLPSPGLKFPQYWLKNSGT